MQRRGLARALSFALALGVVGAAAGPALAASAQTTMTVTKAGKITKFDSKTAFTLQVGSTRYVVNTNDMTHVTIDAKAAKLSQLKAGETVTVKGSLEMETITATGVAEAM